MKRIWTIAAVLLAWPLLGAATPALAQRDTPPGINPYANAMAARLSAERVGEAQPGLYSTGDGRIVFMLEPYHNKYLLRFQDSPEVFVLSAEHSSLGARLLKYDTGTTAIRVSVWGGLTLYTHDSPGGIPATRQGDAPPLAQLAVTQPELQTAMQDESSHLTYMQNVDLRFSAAPSVMAADPQTRGWAFDALVNAARGIEHFLASLPLARQMLTRRVNSVKVTEGAKPAVTLTGQTLLVSFVPDEGHAGHASSLAVQKELSQLLTDSPRDVAAN